MNLRSCAIYFLFALSLPGVAQSTLSLHELLSCYSVSLPEKEKSFNNFLNSIHPEKFRNDEALLHHIFRRTHHLYLKRYESSVSLPEIFSAGKYDCLTGTALFSVILDRFNFQYSLIETNYHIFIIVHLTQGDVILESTDTLNGLVTSKPVVDERIEWYKQNLLAYNRRNAYRYHFSLYHEISPDKLPGLLYFNQAINSFNGKNWEQCADLLKKSDDIYMSPRIEEISFLFIRTITQGECDAEKRLSVLSKIRSYTTKFVAGL